MRGRTNIGGGGIAINATVEQKTIKFGNIIAGDFVEYFSESTSFEPSSFFDFKFVVNGFLIAKVGSIITAFKSGRQVATYAGYNCTYIGKRGNNVIFYDVSANVVGVLSITNEGFTLVDSYSITPRTSSNASYAIWGSDNKICYVMWDKNTSNRKFYVGIFDIASNGALSNYQETILDAPSNSNINMDVCYYEGHFYIVLFGNYTGLTVSISIDVNNVATIDSQYTQNGSVSDQPRIVYKKGQILAIAYYDGGSSSPSTANQGYLVLFNFVTGNYNRVFIADYGEILSIVNNSLVLTSKRTRVSNNYYTYTMNLCRFDDLTLSLTVLDTIVFDLDYQTITKCLQGTLAGIEDDIVYAQLQGGHTTSTVGVYTVSLFEIINNNHIQYPTQKNYVQTYGNGNPIGVAKDSGVAGDIIDVYVPAPTT